MGSGWMDKWTYGWVVDEWVGGLVDRLVGKWMGR